MNSSNGSFRTLGRSFDALLLCTALTIPVATSVAQTAPAGAASAAPEPKKVAVENTAPAPTVDKDTVVLSPFEVVADTRGYYSANTMSGTRFNTKLEDLGSSISVMTKSQMRDFAMLDINDVFLYTAGAEGTGTYTDYTVDRNGQFSDNVQLNPTSANRLRGISAANVSYNNYQITGRMPIDPLIVDGVEVSRGPNANIFGLGNASGTVNQVPLQVNTHANSARVEFRADSYDGYRGTLDINQVVLPDKLAFRVNGGYQHDGFVRKPSGVNTRRYDGFVKYQPFKKTTITASIIDYDMDGNRPNFTPPRDYVTDWLLAGKASWDPVLQ
ncbi:MAG TPA: TonB-dependent receptor plug domain-containing protein, partial [Candidatus Didemnitutus sp.]|nr:TonB-dependent receptor plug domain-containing protein [Candidatus Didemnitutus sp.]